MKTTVNFKRPHKPIEIRFTHLFYCLAFLFTLFANVTAGTWVASAYKADVDVRLKAVETSTAGMPERLSSIEGKMDVILNNVLKVRR